MASKGVVVVAVVVAAVTGAGLALLGKKPPGQPPGAAKLKALGPPTIS